MPFFCLLLLGWLQPTVFWLGIQNTVTVAVADSVMLTAPPNRWVLNQQRPQVQLTLTANQPIQYSPAERYVVCFDSLRLQSSPEGAYEVYLLASPMPTTRLLPESPYFVGVLDTYTLTAPNQPGHACIDIPPTNQIFSAGPINRCIVSIVFRGNKLANGRYAIKTGSLVGGRIRLQAAH